MDMIRLKLEQIDKDRSAGKTFIQGLYSRYPLLVLALGFLAGILIQRQFNLAITLLLAAALVFFVFSLVVFTQSKKIDRRYLLLISGFCCFACLGGLRLLHFVLPPPDCLQNSVGQEKVLATIKGTVITKPFIYDSSDWKFSRFSHSDPSSGFYLKVTQAKTPDGWAQASGKIKVYVYEPVMDIAAGDNIKIHCWLARFNKAQNPGQFDTKEYLAAKNVHIYASVKSRDAITLLKNDSLPFFTKLRSNLSRFAQMYLLADSTAESVEHGLLEALLLGYRGDIDPQTYQAFRKTGLLHFISLSGMHLGILAAILWWICRTIGLGKRGRAVVCILVITIFLFVVPPRPPIIRAAIICYVYFASILLTRYANPANSLSLAAIITLMISPLDCYNAGWQLSFASVAGILLFAKMLDVRFKIWSFYFFSNLRQRDFSPHFLRRFLSALTTIFFVGLAAWIGSFGVLLYHFHAITPFSSLWTVIAFPFVGLILALGYLKILLAFLLPTLSSIAGLLLNIIVKMFIVLVKMIAGLNISSILIGHVSIVFVLCYYAFILFLVSVYFRNIQFKKITVSAVILVLIAFLGFAKWQNTHREDLVLNCLSVGHGQAILLQTPSNSDYLFDAGSLYTPDIGNRVVNPFLDYSGVSSLDAIIISHNDIDHINGIPEIVNVRTPAAVYANPAFSSNNDKWGTAAFLKNCLLKKNLHLQNIPRIFNTESEAKIEVLWPLDNLADDENLSDNNKSNVVLLSYRNKKILICADIESYAQSAILKLYPNLTADVVIVPHHGSAKTLNQDFIRRLDPDILITSCSRSDYQKNKVFIPHSNIKSYYTGFDGMIQIVLTKDGNIKVGTCK